MEAIRDMVNRFMQTEVAPVMDAYERRGELSRDLIRKAGEVGRSQEVSRLERAADRDARA
jgi:hypothetical protein